LSSLTEFDTEYNLIPLTPNEISKGTQIIKNLENKNKIILDLPQFGTNILYYFDHHISNLKMNTENPSKGLFDHSAASTCQILERFFQITNKPELHRLVNIANIVDQAKFVTSPPGLGPIVLTTEDDVVWACNDLIKDIRDKNLLVKLVDTFDKGNLTGWIRENGKFIVNYRQRRQKTLNLKKEIEKAPIIIIQNDSFDLQVESLHFSFAAEEKNYLMLIIVDKQKKQIKGEKGNYRISFRVNPSIEGELLDKLRVDRIAKDLGGGGHKGASSAAISNLENDYKKVLLWVKTLPAEYSETYM
jgi:hypothetical protein